MNPQTNHKPLLTVLIIIGIIIIFILLSPRYAASGVSYRSGSLFTASTVDFGSKTYATTYGNPIIIRTYGHPITVHTSSPTTTQYYQYTSYPTDYVFEDGCTYGNTISTTTGQLCG